jgi:hypothetical protein
MEISLHVYFGSASATFHSITVDKRIDAAQLCEVLRAKALVVWNDGCRGPHIESGKLEADKTYHVIAHNRERTRKIAKTLSMIG